MRNRASPSHQHPRAHTPARPGKAVSSPANQGAARGCARPRGRADCDGNQRASPSPRVCWTFVPLRRAGCSWFLFVLIQKGPLKSATPLAQLSISFGAGLDGVGPDQKWRRRGSRGDRHATVASTKTPSVPAQAASVSASISTSASCSGPSRRVETLLRNSRRVSPVGHVTPEQAAPPDLTGAKPVWGLAC